MSSEKSETKLPVQNVVLLASAVLGAVWLYEGPLKSSRPVDELSNQRVDLVGDRRVQARLWQDPFDAVVRHVDTEKQHKGPRHPHSLQNLVKEIDAVGHAPMTVLVLLADGAPYFDSAESRLRQRYATLAGLERAGYQPVDGEHIRFFEWTATHAAEDTPSSGQFSVCSGVARGNSGCADWYAAPVPVEWYAMSEENSPQALVLWVKDQDLGASPLESLQTMRRILRNAFGVYGRDLHFKVMGPRFSGTLAAMMREATHHGQNETHEMQPIAATDHPLEVYSPWSTTPIDWISRGENTSRQDDNFDKVLSQGGVLFQRAIPTDDRLMQELVEELGRRGLELGAPCPNDGRCDRVALISEWDTLYGRALPSEFKAAARAAKKTLRPSEPVAGIDEELDRQVQRFTYLRGLDGELPKAKRKEGPGEASQGDGMPLLSINERRKLAEQLERPEGRSQLDYVRRLVQVLKEGEAEAQAGCAVVIRGTCPGFRAIGVLGSDVYDKLLILQALKQNFPHAIFFTTDLDARLFHPREIAWTRNLVVASHFGLTLNQALQQAIPPFRDTYQTSAFYAILRALSVLMPGAPCLPHAEVLLVESQRSVPMGEQSAACFHSAPQPRLYEIGEQGPVDLSVDTRSSPGAELTPTIHASRPKPPSVEDTRWVMLYVVCAALVGWGLLIPASQTMYGMTRSLYNRLLLDSRFRARVLMMLGVIGGLLWVVVAPVLVADHEKGEPFSLFDGVSIWPSQLLRGAVIVLAILFIVRIRTRLRKACQDVRHSFDHLLAPHASAAETNVPMVIGQEPLSGERKLAQWCWRDVSWSILSWSLADVAAKPAVVWDEYQRRLTPVYLWGRVLGLSVLFFVVGQLILCVYGLPIAPYRGNVLWYVNQGLLFAAMGLLNIVIFLVLDLTRTTSVFVQKLVNKELACSSPLECLTKLQLVARLTGRIDILVYYPAVLMAIMLLARSTYIDNWHYPLGLAIVVGLGATYVVASAVRLRMASEGARRQVLTELAERRLADLQPNSSQQIDQVMTTIRALREGAFLPYTEVPVFRAVALPSGAYGLFSVIELISSNF